jgi:ribonuclease P protein component
MPGERFPKSARIRRRADFDRVFATRLQLAGRYLRMHLAPATGPEARLGFALARRTLPLAHDRNHLKRMLREDFRRARASLPALDIVITLRERPPAELRPLREDARALFARLGALEPARLGESLGALRRSPDAAPKPASERGP